MPDLEEPVTSLRASAELIHEADSQDAHIAGLSRAVWGKYYI